MGVLKRTIDNAPTNPRDNAREDLTITITKKTVADNIGIIEAICDFPVSENDLLKYTSRNMKDIIIHRIKLKSVGTTET